MISYLIYHRWNLNNLYLDPICFRCIIDEVFLLYILISFIWSGVSYIYILYILFIFNRLNFTIHHQWPKFKVTRQVMRASDYSIYFTYPDFRPCLFMFSSHASLLAIRITRQWYWSHGFPVSPTYCPDCSEVKSPTNLPIYSHSKPKGLSAVYSTSGRLWLLSNCNQV